MGFDTPTYLTYKLINQSVNQVLDPLSQTFAALADPTRRAMLVRLSRGEASVSDLAKPFDMSLPAVTKHLKVLVAAGLVTKRQEAQRRPCSLNADALKDAVDWIEQYRVFWEESFDRLGEHLKSIAATKPTDVADGGVAEKPTRNRKRPGTKRTRRKPGRQSRERSS
jgi:DNA-binding transcriptional ArsR family regulator